jgi:hypothetical protein
MEALRPERLRACSRGGVSELLRKRPDEALLFNATTQRDNRRKQKTEVIGQDEQDLQDEVLRRLIPRLEWHRICPIPLRRRMSLHCTPNDFLRQFLFFHFGILSILLHRERCRS